MTTKNFTNIYILYISVRVPFSNSRTSALNFTLNIKWP